MATKTDQADQAHPTPPARSSGRMSAGERREEIITVAVEHFARNGYNGTSTDAVARDAGISQPYLFRLFRTKRELFLACHDRCHEVLVDLFRGAGRGVPADDRVKALGEAYVAFLSSDRDALLFQMQSYAACADPEIQAHVRARYVELVREVMSITGAGPGGVWEFFSHGMLLNVAASLDLKAVAGEERWAAEWLSPGVMLAEAREERASRERDADPHAS